MQSFGYLANTLAESQPHADAFKFHVLSFAFPPVRSGRHKLRSTATALPLAKVFICYLSPPGASYHKSRGTGDTIKRSHLEVQDIDIGIHPV